MNFGICNVNLTVLLASEKFQRRRFGQIEVERSNKSFLCIIPFRLADPFRYAFDEALTTPNALNRHSFLLDRTDNGFLFCVCCSTKPSFGNEINFAIRNVSAKRRVSKNIVNRGIWKIGFN
jgi:hypothetical protein